MYLLSKDTLHVLSNVPQCEPGAPIPVLVADEQRTLLAYYARTHESGKTMDWTSAPVSDPAGERVTVVRFSPCYTHLFGPPNDEAFSGHPLSAIGLKPYSAVEVLRSSWIKMLERMNAVHPAHDPTSFERYRHFIFAFHDSTFECVAEKFDYRQHRGTTLSALLAELKSLSAIDA